MGSLVDIARAEYTELGFDSIPLIPGSKKPYGLAWQNRLPYRLWRNAPEGVNIGIRAGGEARVAILDCDEKTCPGTFENITNWLAGLGYNAGGYPVVQTASGIGRHVYANFEGTLSGDWRNLIPEIGAGEFRYGNGAQVAAPPSVIKDAGTYALIRGDFRRLPLLTPQDVLPILSNKEIIGKSKPTIPRLAYAILQGRESDRYRSRSEAEQAALVSLINAGFEFTEVHEIFNRYTGAGKYAELKTQNLKNAERWLTKSYQAAAKWAKNHESRARQFAQSAITWAESRAWQGRTGAVDRLVFIAHAQIAYKSGRLTYAAACRDLADMAGVSHMTATRATWRLCDSGLLIPDKKAVADSANLYQLGSLDIPLHSLSTSIVRKCNTMSAHDAFRFGGLGKSAGEVYAALQKRTATVDELAEITGRHERTVKRAIDRMEKLADPLTGEYLPMVASDDGEIYHSLPVDFDRLAYAVGTAGMAERQRKEHIKERRLHALLLQANQKRG
jgi:hypothetical protein